MILCLQNLFFLQPYESISLSLSLSLPLSLPPSLPPSLSLSLSFSAIHTVLKKPSICLIDDKKKSKIIWFSPSWPVVFY